MTTRAWRAMMALIVVLFVCVFVLSVRLIQVAGSTTHAQKETRCAALSANYYNCVGGDTPERWQKRGCFPIKGSGDVVTWVCQRS